MRRNIWFFGDSYLEHDANWVRYVADRCKAKIQELGVGGSSITYLLKRLNHLAPKIKKEDYVVVGITDAARHHFAGLHLMLHMVRKPISLIASHHNKLNPYSYIEIEYLRKENLATEDIKTVQWQMQILDLLNAYNGYVEHLFNYDEAIEQSGAIVSHIIRGLLPNLPTKNVVYFYTIDREQYTESPFWYKTDLKKFPTVQSFYHQQVDYFAHDRDMLDENKITDIIDTPNHWIEDKEMQKRFWTINNPILKKIGADNPDLII